MNFMLKLMAISTFYILSHLKIYTLIYIQSNREKDLGQAHSNSRSLAAANTQTGHTTFTLGIAKCIDQCDQNTRT